MLSLITNQDIFDHVSEDIVNEFEEIILSDARVLKCSGDKWFMRVLGSLFWRLHEKNFNFSIPKYFLPFRLKRDYFVILMGIRFRKCMPYFLFSSGKHVFMFDTWPKHYRVIIEFINSYNIDTLFITSRQGAKQLQSECICPVYWIPEGVDPSNYRYYQYEEKDIDVLEFGRKYFQYHESIRPYLKHIGKIHLFEYPDGKLIFPTHDSFIEGLARSKISICFPSNLTHPDRAGDTETMTIRYLQSMVSKCLIIGHAPMEMVDLFGYNPVIEIDQNDPCNQLSSVLDNYKTYIPLIERNYAEVLTNHTWMKRWYDIAKLLPKPIYH